MTGPRQSGKTTLVRHIFPDKPYASLENPDTREFALRDPRRFLLGYADGAIIDEVQRCPELLSYLQGMVDQSEERGRVGQLVDMTRIGSDCGVDPKTVKAWLAILAQVLPWSDIGELTGECLV